MSMPFQSKESHAKYLYFRFLLVAKVNNILQTAKEIGLFLCIGRKESQRRALVVSALLSFFSVPFRLKKLISVANKEQKTIE